MTSLKEGLKDRPKSIQHEKRMMDLTMTHIKQKSATLAKIETVVYTNTNQSLTSTSMLTLLLSMRRVFTSSLNVTKSLSWTVKRPTKKSRFFSGIAHIEYTFSTVPFNPKLLTGLTSDLQGLLFTTRRIMKVQYTHELLLYEICDSLSTLI